MFGLGGVHVEVFKDVTFGAAGQRAISSHTGSLAVPAAVRASLVRQAGAISAGNFDELLDVIMLSPVSSPEVCN